MLLWQYFISYCVYLCAFAADSLCVCVCNMRMCVMIPSLQRSIFRGLPSGEQGDTQRVCNQDHQERCFEREGGGTSDGGRSTSKVSPALYI